MEVFFRSLLHRKVLFREIRRKGRKIIKSSAVWGGRIYCATSSTRRRHPHSVRIIIIIYLFAYVNISQQLIALSLGELWAAYDVHLRLPRDAFRRKDLKFIKAERHKETLKKLLALLFNPAHIVTHSHHVFSVANFSLLPPSTAIAIKLKLLLPSFSYSRFKPCCL